MRISRLIAVVAVVGGLCLAATSSASASPSATCTGANGKIKLSPGLTEKAAVQNITVKGELTGCSGEEAQPTYRYQIHAKTAEAVTCSALTSGALSGAESTIKIKTTEGNSSGEVSFELIEGAGAFSSGPLAGGPFNGGTASGSLTQSYVGGATCGVPTEHHGKPKPAKKVNKGEVTAGSATLT